MVKFIPGTSKEDKDKTFEIARTLDGIPGMRRYQVGSPIDGKMTQGYDYGALLFSPASHCIIFEANLCAT